MNGDNVPFGQMFVLDQCVDQDSQHGGHGVHRGIGRDFVGGIVVKAAERREREEKEEKDQELDSYTLVHALHARLLSSKTLPAVLQHQPTFAFDVVDTVGEGGLPGKREKERKGGREGGRREKGEKEERKRNNKTETINK